MAAKVTSSRAAEQNSDFDDLGLVRQIAADSRKLLLGPGFGDRLEMLEDERSLTDSPWRFRVLNRSGRIVGYGKLSALASPESVADEVARARTVAARVPGRLAEVPLLPLYEGTASGRSFAVFPYLRTCSSFKLLRVMQVSMLRDDVLSWLMELAAASRHTPVLSGVKEDLESLLTVEQLPAVIARSAEDALGRLVIGTWTPAGGITHGDLWHGNVLWRFGSLPFSKSSQTSFRFNLIDWGGAQISGYPILDILRALRSFSVSELDCARWIDRYIGVIQIPAREVSFQLVAAFGRLYRHLNFYPVARYLHSVSQSWIQLDRAMHAIVRGNL